MVKLTRIFVHCLAGHSNTPDAIKDTLRAAEMLKPGMRVDGPGAEVIVGSCEPVSGGRLDARTEVTVGTEVLSVFDKVHVLPYKDTFKFNYDHMYHNHIAPYFHTCQVGEFSSGFDFAHEGVRFSVVGVVPEGVYAVVGCNTQVFYEGPPIERDILHSANLVPYQEGLHERYRPTTLSLDSEALLRDYVRPYFAQRSAKIVPGDVLEIKGVRFKVTGCAPSTGGGVGRGTQLECKGVALKESFAKSKAKAKAKANAVAQTGHTAPDEGSGCSIS